MEAAALKLYGVAIQLAAEAVLLTDLREQRARAAAVALVAGKVDAAEVAAVVDSANHRTPRGIRAWYRRALVELDGQKAGEA
jgi:hypothetical protein